jgi:two-component system response regulator GlrR
MAQPRIVIIDRHERPRLGGQIQAILQRERSCQVDLLEGALPDITEGLAPLPALLIPILSESQEKAAQCLATLQAQTADTPLLPVVSAADLHEILDELLHWTADFLLTPLREAEVSARVWRLIASHREPEQGRANKRLSEPCELAHLVGEDPAFLAVKRKIPLLARCEAPVLLTGETGTGKELCARALHYLSRRAGKPFLPVNCGAIPMELFERELFGHTKGAFTGAWADQPGLIAEAEGGTLFLDEIETLSLGAQAKLLRFLQDQTYQALGSPRLRQADVWILAATNTELSHHIRERTFREDLFYRLAVMVLTLPALRERRVDIPLLTSLFWTRYGGAPGERPRQWSPRALEALGQYTWPGNIRELQNVIRQVAVLSDALTIEPEDLPLPLPLVRVANGDSFQAAKAQVIAQFEQAYCTKLLHEHQGNVTQAARAAQMERRTFGRLLKKYQIAKR